MSDWIFVNDTWISSGQWSAADRALHYGDGLFETIRFAPNGQAPLWMLHRERLLQGLIALDFPINSMAIIDTAWNKLPREAKNSAGKLLISRGVAPRGYAIPKEPTLTVLWQNFAAPAWALIREPEGFISAISDVMLAEQPLLAGIKHLNRLEQVLARNRFPEHCHEVVMCSHAGFAIEGCMSNLFFMQNNTLKTPDVNQCGVDGVVRRWLMSKHNVSVVKITPDELAQADAVFFCNSLNGIVPVRELSGHVFPKNAAWMHVQQLQHELETLFC